MTDINILTPPADDASSHEAEIDRYIADMWRLQEQMDADRAEIQAMQAETRAILADVMAYLKAA